MKPPASSASRSGPTPSWYEVVVNESKPFWWMLCVTHDSPAMSTRCDPFTERMLPPDRRSAMEERVPSASSALAGYVSRLRICRQGVDERAIVEAA